MRATISRHAASRASGAPGHAGSCHVGHSSALIDGGAAAGRTGPTRIGARAAGRADRAAGPQADDGPAGHQGAAARARAATRTAPNASNADESKATPYPNLPDPLTFKNGQKVTTARDWTRRRAGDRRGFRPRGVRPRAGGDADGEVGGDRDERRDGRRRAGGHQAAGRPRGQLRRTRSSRVDIQLTLTTPANARGRCR